MTGRASSTSRRVGLCSPTGAEGDATAGPVLSVAVTSSGQSRGNRRRKLSVAVAAKILIIEDDRDVLETLARILAEEGYSTVGATNGKEGIAVFEAEHPALVITDLIMPEKEGIETIAELRRLRPDVKILAISGGGILRNMDFLEMAAKLGASATLAKPFEPDDVVGSVRRLLVACDRA